MLVTAGERKVVELKPGGKSVEVTEENKREYVALVAEHRTSGAIREQTKAFCEVRLRRRRRRRAARQRGGASSPFLPL